MQLRSTLQPAHVGLGLALLAAGCTSTDPVAPRALPGATLTPHLQSPASAIACGDDITFGDGAVPDLRFTYAYDSGGRLAHATGVYAAGGPDAKVDYAYDAADRFTHFLETDGPGQARYEIAAAYDAAGNLVSYTWDGSAPGYHDHWDYTLSNFLGLGQPTREVMTEDSQPPFGYDLSYDAAGRLVRAVPDGGGAGDATTWTYDDAAGTITVDTGNGAYHGVIAYDETGHELSETWGGSDPSVIASVDELAWSDDQLLSATYRAGSTAAPQTLSTLEVDTVRYDCSSARVSQDRRGQPMRAGARHRDRRGMRW